jgi:IS30 family transposase
MKKQRKAFTQLSQFDRDRIESMWYYGNSQKEIAQTLERDKSTISRELKNYINKHGRYKAKAAQEKAEKNRKGSKVVGMKIEGNPELKK